MPDTDVLVDGFIEYTRKRLHVDSGTEESEQLERLIEKIVKEKEQRFVDFFNKAEAINKRIHQIELLPGLGKKYTKEILNERKVKEFESFADIKKRISNLPFPEKAVEKRIFQELTGFERYNLFTY